MPTLTDYSSFNGRHHETGYIHNYLAHNGITAPHTRKPYSEALMLGVSGGITAGYFTFAYDGYDPHVALLTRNTFDPQNTLLSRLGVVRDVRHTNKAGKAAATVVEILEEGSPVIAWAEMWSLPYNALAYDEGLWANFPILIFGYEEEADEVRIADRAAVPLTVTTGELTAARARIKKDKFRVMTMDIPDPERLPAAAASGIWDCIKLFTEKPPRGSVKNFGLAAYRNWIELLTQPKQRQSWEKEFPAGLKLYAALTSVFGRMGTIGICGDAERGLYSDFLEEAAVILDKPALREVSSRFRESSGAWRELGRAVLPDRIPALRETRELIEQRSKVFIDQGCDGLATLQAVDKRLKRLREQVIKEFPLDAAGVKGLREELAGHLQRIHDIEATAVSQLREAMSA